MCIDNQRLAGLFDFMVIANPSFPGDLMKQIVKYINILNFLNLTFRFEAGFIFGGSV